MYVRRDGTCNERCKLIIKAGTAQKWPIDTLLWTAEIKWRGERDREGLENMVFIFRGGAVRILGLGSIQSVGP